MPKKMPVDRAYGIKDAKKSMKDIALVVPITSAVLERVFMPTELTKARQHLGRAQGTGNAGGTVGPKEPQGSRGAERPKGAPRPESSKSGKKGSEISKRGGHKDPYSNYKTGVGGMASSASHNFMVLKNVKTGKYKKIRLGTAHKAKFDHTGNIIRVTIDGKKYPAQNHLVKLPSGVYRYTGMVSVASKVGKL